MVELEIHNTEERVEKQFPNAFLLNTLSKHERISKVFLKKLGQI